MRRRAKPAKAKVKAKRPASGKLPKNVGGTVRDLEKHLAESLEREKATGEILRVMRGGHSDAQLVFDTIVRSAVRLCNAANAAVFRTDGKTVYEPANYGSSPEALAAMRSRYPRPLDMETTPGIAILTRSVVHIPDIEDPSAIEFVRQSGRRIGIRSVVTVPMLREGEAVGALVVARREAGRFSDAELELLKTFADQAVIAIENVRLFKELEARNTELTVAVEQEQATSDVLRIISRSPADLPTVLQTIAETAARVCGASDGVVFLTVGTRLRIMAHHGAIGALIGQERDLDRTSMAGRAAVDRAPVHVSDLQAETKEFPVGSEVARGHGHRSSLAVPLLRDGVALGALLIRRLEVQPFTDKQIELLKTFADQAVIAVENVRLFKELEARNTDLTESLEQQTATGEILRVISRSPTDVQPIFNAIVRNASRLCGGEYAIVTRFDGELLHLAAQHNPRPGTADETAGFFPQVPRRETSFTARAFLDASVVHVSDIETEELDASARETYRRIMLRASLSVPLVHEGRPIGVVSVSRATLGPFSPRQIALLQTFAEQAVIAVENVRLFNELQEKNRALTTAHSQVTEALEQQTATSEILRVISRSQTDVQPVFDTIVRSAVALCDGLFSTLFQFDGDVLHILATHNLTPDALEALRRAYPARPTRALAAGRAILERAVVHISDVELEPESQQRAIARAVGWRSALVVPMLREGAPIGVITVGRAEPGPFSDSEIELLKTFADQAVIAVENVRLFNELEAKNRALTMAHAQVTEALEQQTATAEILRVISRSQTDVQPVFDAIARSAVTLCRGLFSAVFQFDGELIYNVAQHNFTPEALEEVHRIYPTRPTRALGTGRAILERAVAHIPDFELDPEFQNQALSRAIGYRSSLSVPMLREGAPIGVIWVARAEPGLFSGNEIELLKTFADQAVIAVENVRLFKELEARTGELTQSVEKLTALGEVSRAVSSTLDVETVLDTIVSRASQLAGAAGCAIFEYDEAAERFELRATHHLDAEFVEALRAVPLRKGEGLMGRAAEMREPIQVPDITEPGAYQSSARDTLIRFGYRALLSVPLLREDQIIGSLSFNRKAPGEFPPEVVDVLKTFATQSALAIQNARLFREIADKSAQLEAASRHKSEFLANMSHELRTPLNAIIGFSEILAEKMFGDINDKQTEYLQDILESGRHLLSLINDILDLSKIEAGRMELELSEFDLPTAIDNALILVRERASRRGIRLGSTIDPQLGMIGGDERKVKQVLLNLLSNALKFTPEGGRIDVGARLHDHLAEVSVADTGIGIAPGDQESVFEEFRQVGTADKKAEGTGLGLALSRKFIELHGGKIWVRSQVGAGSTFTFALPLSR
jgi:GAF domain-containing protein